MLNQSRGRIGKTCKTVRSNLVRSVFVIGLALGGAMATASTTLVPEAQAFGFSDITGAVKKVGGAVKGAAKTVARDVKNTSKIVRKNAKDWGTSVSAGVKDIGRGAKNVGKKVGAGAKDWSTSVGAGVKDLGRGAKKVAKKVGAGAKDWGTSVGAGIKDLGRGAKWVGKKALDCFGACEIKEPIFVDKPGYEPQPGRLKAGKRKSADQVNRLRRDTKLPPRRSKRDANGKPVLPMPGGHQPRRQAKLPPPRNTNRAGLSKRKTQGSFTKGVTGTTKLLPRRGGKPTRKVIGMTKENLGINPGRLQKSKRPKLRDRSVQGRPLGNAAKRGQRKGVRKQTSKRKASLRIQRQRKSISSSRRKMTRDRQMSRRARPDDRRRKSSDFTNRKRRMMKRSRR